MSKEEETRIEREAMDQKGFLPGLERLLLAVDESAVGRMAARLAGLLAGAQGMPVTILKLDGQIGASRRADRGEQGQRPGQGEEAGKPEHAEQDEAKDIAPKDMAGAQSRVRKRRGTESRSAGAGKSRPAPKKAPPR